VYELAGGSSLKEGQSPLDVISHEVEEETGLKLEPGRFIQHETRQALATLSAHGVHLFSAELTIEELSQLKNDLGNVHGVVEDTEQTYVEIWKLKDILRHQLVDWTNLGMILSVLSFSQ
jgi:8-oxo-dGTP pyrophosphatase MutT (NUDIX family)